MNLIRDLIRIVFYVHLRDESVTQTHFLEFNSCEAAAAAAVLWLQEAFMASTSVYGG